MPTNYTPTGRVRTVIGLPNDGDQHDAATYNGPLQAIADNAAYARAVAAGNYTLKQAATGGGGTVSFAAGLTHAIPVGGRIEKTLSLGSDIVRSYDGINWTTEFTPEYAKNAAAYSYPLNLWVAIGEDGIHTSDGSGAWVMRSMPAQYSIRGIAVGPAGELVVVGDMTEVEAYVLWSADGVAWAQQASGLDDGLFDVEYGLGTFVAVGGNSLRPRIIASPDGLSWGETYTVPPLKARLNRVCFNGRVFAAVSTKGEIVVSETGYSWELRETTYPSGFGNGIAADPVSGAIVASAGPYGQLAVSFDDGFTWERRAVNGPTGILQWTAVGFAHGRFLLGNQFGDIAVGLRR